MSFDVFPHRRGVTESAVAESSNEETFETVSHSAMSSAAWRVVDLEHEIRMGHDQSGEHRHPSRTRVCVDDIGPNPAQVASYANDNSNAIQQRWRSGYPEAVQVNVRWQLCEPVVGEQRPKRDDVKFSLIGPDIADDIPNDDRNTA